MTRIGPGMASLAIVGTVAACGLFAPADDVPRAETVPAVVVCDVGATCDVDAPSVLVVVGMDAGDCARSGGVHVRHFAGAGADVCAGVDY